MFTNPMLSLQVGRSCSLYNLTDLPVSEAFQPMIGQLTFESCTVLCRFINKKSLKFKIFTVDFLAINTNWMHLMFAYVRLCACASIPTE